jgi:hypothetical protein
MDSGKDGTDSAEHLDRDLSLREATRLYDVSLRTLRNRLRCGWIPAYKTHGPWGQEWRVNGRTLEASEFARRPVELGTDDGDPRVAALEAELGRLRRIVVVERERADQADRELGYAMLECGRLRSALAKALQLSQGCADGSPGPSVGAGLGTSRLGGT